MKLNNNGWGYRMMAFLMTILIMFLIIAIYYIYNYYDQIKGVGYDVKIVEIVGEK